jgi:tetratricopeptide (TPR) repeat protein
MPSEMLGIPTRPVEMDEGIPADLGAELLVRLDSMHQAHMSDLSFDVRKELVEAVHGIPRALELLVGLRARNPLIKPERLIDRLLATPQALKELVSTTYIELSEAELAIVRAVAVVGVPMELDGAVDLCMRTGPADAGLTSADFEDGAAHLVATRVLGLDSSTGRIRIHPLDAEVIVDGLPDAGPWSRSEISRSVADWYREATLPSDQWDERADLRPARAEIRHRVNAGDFRRASELVLTVARAAVRFGDALTLLPLFEDLRARPGDELDRANVALAYAYVRHLAGPNDESIPLAQEAAELFESVSMGTLQAEALSLQGDALRYAGRSVEALTVLEKAIARLQQSSGEPDMRAHDVQLSESIFRLGLAQVYAGMPEAAVQTALQLQVLGGQGDDLHIRAMHGDLISLALLLTGDLSGALSTAEQCLEFYRRSGFGRGDSTYVENVIGLVHLELGDAQSACTSLTSGWIGAKALGVPRAEGLNAFNLTWALVLSGQAGKAAEAAHAAASSFLRDGGQEVAIARGLEACLAAIDTGDSVGAIAHLESVTGSASRNPELYRPSESALRSMTALIHASTDSTVLGSPDQGGVPSA